MIRVAVFGGSLIQYTHKTRGLKQAKRLREVRDIEWSVRFAAAEDLDQSNVASTPHDAPPVSPEQLRRLVVEYVERMDARFKTEKMRAIFAALREIVGEATPITAVDYDACMKVREHAYPQTRPSSTACCRINPYREFRSKKRSASRCSTWLR